MHFFNIRIFGEKFKNPFIQALIETVVNCQILRSPESQYLVKFEIHGSTTPWVPQAGQHMSKNRF